MPELPEVETVRAGAEPLLRGRRLRDVHLRRSDLRWPIPTAAVSALPGRRCRAIERRAKYLLLHFAGRPAVTALVHLGMSGRLLVEHLVGKTEPEWRLHEHWRMHFGDRLVRFIDPRRFGSLDVVPTDSLVSHRLLCRLGREPLTPEFDGSFVHSISRAKRASVKNMLMDSRLIVGVGNIYASEACWRARVRPRRAAKSLRKSECDALADAVRQVLEHAIASGGTTLRDYRGVSEQNGYFARELQVYDRAGYRCRRCRAQIKRTVDGGRSTFWCPGCQR